MSETMNPEASRLVRRLTLVWLDFERELENTPILRRLREGRFTREDYRTVLRNLRQQVIEGSRWIARAASSCDASRLELRSLVLRHAVEEHRDYELLEHDYVAAGGSAAELRTAPKNVGSEALHAFLMHRASEPNPVDLVGALFLIEGLGQKMAASWAERIEGATGLDASATRFLRYHGENDERHLAKLEPLLASFELDEATSDRAVRTARVVARLYRLQLEELEAGGNARA
jgi:3-oxoacyl-[acyl-carrier-protein] synthase-3